MARDVLRDVIDETLQGRKVFAAALGCDESLLAKKLNGVGGRDFGLGELEALDRELQVRWMKRYGKELGVEVHEIPQAQLVEQMFEAFEELKRKVQLAQVGRPKQLKVEELPAREPARKAG